MKPNPDDLPSTEYLTAAGEPYVGAIEVDAKGKASGAEFVCCGRCGGSGKWKRRLECFSCSGEGGKDKSVRIYTPEQYAKYEKQRDKRTEAKVAKEIERARVLDEKFNAFRDANAKLFEVADGAGNKFLDDLVAKCREWGSLTEPQLRAMKQVVARVEDNRARYGSSSPYGTQGERVEIEVMCTQAGSFERRKFKGRGRETAYVSELCDGSGNAFLVWSPSFSMERGQRAIIKGTVKTHQDKNGFVQTVLIRPAMVKLLAPMATLASADVADAYAATPVEVDAEDFAEAEPAPAFGT